MDYLMIEQFNILVFEFMNELKRSEILLIIVSYVATSRILGFKWGGGGVCEPIIQHVNDQNI